jgi:hypothetical protein
VLIARHLWHVLAEYEAHFNAHRPHRCLGQAAPPRALPDPVEGDELVREGARRMLAEALKAEVDACIALFADQRDEHGHRFVVRNGHHEPRTVLTNAGTIEVKAPRVNDKRIDAATGERQRFSSSILPPWCRKGPAVTEVRDRGINSPSLNAHPKLHMSGKCPPKGPGFVLTHGRCFYQAPNGLKQFCMRGAIPITVGCHQEDS